MGSKAGMAVNNVSFRRYSPFIFLLFCFQTFLHELAMGLRGPA